MNSNAQAPKTWHEIKNPHTGKLVAKYCPQTHEIESVDRGKRAVIKLPVECSEQLQKQ